MLLPFRYKVMLVLVAIAPTACGLTALFRRVQERDGAPMRFQLTTKGSQIDVEVGQGELAVAQGELKRWVENAADAIQSLATVRSAAVHGRDCIKAVVDLQR